MAQSFWKCLFASILVSGPVGAADSVQKKPSSLEKTKVPSPSETDPDKYNVILDNETVRVFRYHDEPGAKTKMHHHEAFVLYVLAPFKRRLTFPDGTKKERQFATGDVIYMDAQDHIGENVGSTPTEAVIVEVKGRGAAAPSNSDAWKPGTVAPTLPERTR